MHLLAHIVSVGAIHLAVLREGYEHWADQDGSKEKWKQQIKDTYNIYRKFYEAVIPKWSTWRFGYLKQETSSSGFWHTIDGVKTSIFRLFFF